MRHSKETKGKVHNIIEELIRKEEEFQNLSLLKILVFWRHGPPERDEEGMAIMAKAVRLPSRQRDLLEGDAAIEICTEVWDSLTERWRRRLIQHELRHFSVDMLDDGTPDFDKEDRVKYGIVPHDVIFKTFKAEVTEWGFSRDEIEMVKFLYKAYKRYKKGKIKLYSLPEVLHPKDEDEG